MSLPTFRIDVAGEALSAEASAMLSQIHLVQPAEEPGRARLRFAAIKDQSGDWPLTAQSWCRPGTALAVRIGLYPDVEVCLLDGFITATRLGLPLEESNAFLEVDARDRLWLLDRSERVRTFPDQTLTEIVQAILDDYDLDGDLELPEWTSEADRTLCVQRGTDWAFLSRLARRLGLAFFTRCDATTGDVTVHLHPPRLTTPELPSLAVHMGSDSNLRELEVSEHSPRWLAVAAPEVSAFEKGWSEHLTQPQEQELLGAQAPESGLAAVLPSEAVEQARVIHDGDGWAPYEAEGQAERLRWVVTASGSLDTTRYSAILLPHSTVAIRGLGQRHSGHYYLSRVEHELTVAAEAEAPSYVVHFEAMRNATGLTGSERF